MRVQPLGIEHASDDKKKQIKLHWPNRQPTSFVQPDRYFFFCIYPIQMLNESSASIATTATVHCSRYMRT